MQNGDAYLYGVGNYDGTNPSNASTVQSVLGNYTSDHNTAVADHAIVQGYDTRLTNVEGEVSQLGQKVDEKGIKLVDFAGSNSTTSATTGEIYYNTTEKKLYKKNDGGSWSIIPFIEGAVYTLGTDLYVFNGTDMVLVTEPYPSNSYPLEYRRRFEGGATVGTSTMPANSVEAAGYLCAKLPVKEGDIYKIKGLGGTDARLWYLYDADGVLTRVASSSYRAAFPDIVLTIEEGEAYLVVNFRGAEEAYYLRDMRLQQTVGELRIEQEETKKELNSAEGELSGIDARLNDTADIASSIVWTSGRFIKNDGSIQSTSATNKVGVVSIQGYKKISFNWSVKKGGSYSKYGWKIVNTNGAILSKSADIASTSTTSGEVEMLIPDGAVSLYVSANMDLTTTQVCVVSSPIELRLSALEKPNTISVENSGVQAYMSVRYNDADYSYTKFPFAIAGAGNPGYMFPTGYVIDTPIDAGAASRTLELADNAGFTGSRTYTLDLVSESFEVTNLIPGKLYYFRVYKDATPSDLLNSGSFRTDGLVRDLKIAAASGYEDGDLIQNVRDIGGWKTSDGKRIRYGRIFRGNELNHSSGGVITPYVSQAGIDELEELGVSAELDLRGGSYSESALGEDVAYANFDPALMFFRLNIYWATINQLRTYRNCLRQIITWLAAGKGIYIHCQGGCDRTGFMCALIEGICGVSENDINHDYELSNRSRAREYYTVAVDGYDGDFKFAIEYIKGLLEYNGITYVYYRGNYYYASANVSDFTPTPISDASLIATLDTLPFGSFKECWRRLMRNVDVGMTDREFDKLEQLLCS